MTTVNLPLRVLAVIPTPSEMPRLDGEAVWLALSDALKPLRSSGLVELDRLRPPTENALRNRLQEHDWHVVHFIGPVASRRSAHYDTLTFEGSTGAGRRVTVSYVTALLARHAAMRLLVVADAAMPASLSRNFYERLATGATIVEASTLFGRRATIVPIGTCATNAPLVNAYAADTPSADPPAARVALDAAEERRHAARRECERKRAAAEFDVFLCHNRSDKPHVRDIATALEEHGILPWLDERELRPGEPWQAALEQQIGSIKAAAVFVGAAGVGPWQEQEIYSFLREFVARRSPVIPVLLRDAPAQPALPIFLRSMTWVDFRVDEPEPLAQLIWGITGERPD